MKILHDRATDVVYLLFKDSKSYRQETRGGGSILLDLGRKDPKTGKRPLLGVEILQGKYSLSRPLAEIAHEFREPRILMFDTAWESKLDYHKRASRMKRTTPCTGTRMYVLVNRESLSPVQWGVQAAHAVATFMDKYHPTKDPILSKKIRAWARRHKTFTFLACTQKQRIDIFNKKMGLRYADFFEPDLSGMWTASAFEPITREEGQKIFKDLPLL